MKTLRIIICIFIFVSYNMLGQVHKHMIFEKDSRYVKAESILDSLNLKFQRTPLNWEFHPEIFKSIDKSIKNELRLAYNLYTAVGNEYDFDDKNLITEFRKGYIHFLLKEFKRGKDIFEYSYKKEVINMGDRFSAKRSTSAKWLLRLYVNSKQPDSALKLAQKMYHSNASDISYFCGNAEVEERIYQARIMGEIYILKEDLPKALSYLLPEIFMGGTSINYSLVDFTSENLLKKYSREFLQRELDKSIEGIYSRVQEDTLHHSFSEGPTFFISFFDVEIEVPDWVVYMHYKNGEESQIKISDLERLFKEDLKKAQIYKNISSY